MFGLGIAPWGELRGRHRGRRRGAHRGLWDGRGRGGREPMLGSGDLRPLLLALLEQKPRHGYELIQELERQFGHEAPGPGSVYPALMFLEELGYVSATASPGTWGLFAITEEGSAVLNQAPALQRERVRSHPEMPPREVRQALRVLRGALLRHGRSWDGAEIARITQIVEAAAAAISTGAEYD